MNRAQRRAAEREAARAARKAPPLCPPRTHAFGELVATVEGEKTASRIVCRKCRRTFEQVMEESPDDLAYYVQWLRSKGLREE